MATKKASRRQSKSVPPTQFLINGQSVVFNPTAGMTIGQAAEGIARANGLKSFSILVNGVKLLNTEQANKSLTGVRTLEVFAKDTRG